MQTFNQAHTGNDVNVNVYVNVNIHVVWCVDVNERHTFTINIKLQHRSTLSLQLFIFISHSVSCVIAKLFSIICSKQIIIIIWLGMNVTKTERRKKKEITTLIKFETKTLWVNVLRPAHDQEVIKCGEVSLYASNQINDDMKMTEYPSKYAFYRQCTLAHIFQILLDLIIQNRSNHQWLTNYDVGHSKAHNDCKQTHNHSIESTTTMYFYLWYLTYINSVLQMPNEKRIFIWKFNFFLVRFGVFVVVVVVLLWFDQTRFNQNDDCETNIRNRTITKKN